MISNKAVTKRIIIVILLSFFLFGGIVPEKAIAKECAGTTTDTCEPPGDDGGNGGGEGDGEEEDDDDDNDEEEEQPSPEELRKVAGGSGNILTNSVTGLSGLPEGVVETKHDPINPVTGEYVLKYTDLSIPSPGVKFQLQRTYTTNFTSGTALGKKWWHSYERRLVLNWDLSMMVRNRTGFPRVYEANSTEASTVGSYDEDPLIDKDLSQIEYTSSEWNTNILSRNADGTYTERTKEGIEYTYNGYYANWREEGGRFPPLTTLGFPIKAKMQAACYLSRIRTATG